MGLNTPSKRSKFCSQSCSSSSKVSAITGKKGSKNGNWKGGLTKSQKGYWYVLNRDHPRAMKNGYVKRADLVLEKKLGRPLLPSELAHHINEIKDDDSPENLELHTHDSHRELHAAAKRKPKPEKPQKAPKAPEPSIETLIGFRKSHSLRAMEKLLGMNYETIRQRLIRFNSVP